MSIFSNVDFCMPIFLQYLLISWFRLFSSNSFSILRFFTKCQLLKFTFKDFTGLSLLQISVQIRNSMQIFWGSNCTFELTRHRTLTISACLWVILFTFVKCGGPIGHSNIYITLHWKISCIILRREIFMLKDMKGCMEWVFQKTSGT